MAKTTKQKPSIGRDDARRTAGYRRAEIAIDGQFMGNSFRARKHLSSFPAGTIGSFQLLRGEALFLNVWTGTLQIANAKRSLHHVTLGSSATWKLACHLGDKFRVVTRKGPRSLPVSRVSVSRSLPSSFCFCFWFGCDASCSSPCFSNSSAPDV
jgi:hypothetical protein